MMVTWLKTTGSTQPPDRVVTAVIVPTGTGHVSRQELPQQSHKVHFMSRRSPGTCFYLPVDTVAQLSSAEVGSEGWLDTEHMSIKHYLFSGLLQTGVTFEC